MYNKNMKSTVKALFPKISTIAVLLSLVTISIFQYSWVVSSAANDISELYKSLTTTITNKMLNEFSNKPLFSSEVQFVNYTRFDDEILKELNEKYDNFKTSYTETFSLEIYRVDLYTHDFNVLLDNRWKLKEDIPFELNKIIKEFNGATSFVYENNVIWQVLPIKGQRNQLIIFRIDTFAYYINKINEYTKQIFRNYEVVVYEKLPTNGFSIDGQEYKYSPFKRERWFSQIPLPIVIFPGLETRESNPELAGHPSPRPPRDINRLMHGNIYIDILEDGVPLVTKKENYLTIQWLLNLLLLIGIGIGYFLIYFQILSLKKLRLKEKEFIATITHELRTPLTVIQSAADNIESGFLSVDRVKQYGHLITDQSTRLSSMIEGILLFSRLEGKAEQPPVLRRVFYDDLKISLEAFTQSLMEKDHNNITIDFNELPVSSISDKETIELILTNLISNSNKHAYNKSENGKIRIIGSVLSDDSLQFKVEDYGIGINKSEKKHLFEPFYRGDRSHKQQVKGSGLGLFLANKKANLLDGRIEIDTSINKGSIFKLVIPYIKS